MLSKLWQALLWLFMAVEPCPDCKGDMKLDEHGVCNVCFNKGYVVPTKEVVE